jgi:hypothetical protein
MSGAILAGVVARATDLVFIATAPDDRDFAGVQIWLAQTDDPDDAELIAHVAGRRNHRIHYVYKTDVLGLVEGITYYAWMVSVDASGNAGDFTLIGSDQFRLASQLDLGAEAVDLSYHATGRLRSGQLATTQNDTPISTGLQPIHASCSDGDVVSFSDLGFPDLGVPPVIRFNMDSLPALSAGSVYVKRPTA